MLRLCEASALGQHEAARSTARLSWLGELRGVVVERAAALAFSSARRREGEPNQNDKDKGEETFWLCGLFPQFARAARRDRARVRARRRALVRVRHGLIRGHLAGVVAELHVELAEHLDARLGDLRHDGTRAALAETEQTHASWSPPI